MVELTSNDPTEATVPASVTIPTGEVSASFDIAAVDDGLPDGDQTVEIVARAADVDGDAASVIVTDDGDAPTTDLAAGDILFICFNADNDSFGFVALADIAAGEIIYFTDEEWDGFAFGDRESDTIWTAPAGGLSAGAVVIFTGNDTTPTTVTGGGTVSESDELGLSSGSETIYAYQGLAARQPVTFLAAIANHTGDSIANTGLTAGVDAFFTWKSLLMQRNTLRSAAGNPPLPPTPL